MTNALPSRRSFLTFALATLAAASMMLVGWLVAEASKSGATTEEIAGVEVVVPDGWIPGTPTPGLLAVRSDPFDPFARLEIAEAPGAPASAAADFLALAAQRYPYFHLVSESASGGSVWIEYRFVTTGAGGSPVVIAGLLGFVETAEGPRSLSVEARERDAGQIEGVFPDREGGTR